jgi:RNA-directed DNA polymerase
MLQPSEEKSKVIYANMGTIYLGHQIRVETGFRVQRLVINGIPQKTRVFSQRMILRVPRDKVKSFCQTHKYGDFDRHIAKHITFRIHRSDVEIIRAYNAELRGFAEFYNLACDVKNKLAPLQHLWKLSLYMTLANKHKCSVPKILKRLRSGHKDGMWYDVSGRRKFEEVYSLRKRRRNQSPYANIDKQINIGTYTYARTELVSRLNANRCEYCEKVGGLFRSSPHEKTD